MSETFVGQENKSDVFTAYWNDFGLLKAAAVQAGFGLRGHYKVAHDPESAGQRLRNWYELFPQYVEALLHSKIDRPMGTDEECSDEILRRAVEQAIERRAPAVPIETVEQLARLATECTTCLEIVAKWDDWRTNNPLVSVSAIEERFVACHPAELIRRVWAIMRALGLAMVPPLPPSLTAHEAIRAFDEVLTCCRANGHGEEVAGLRRKSIKSKKSTEKGEGRDKLISMLTAHHEYAKGGSLRQEPIGANELAREAEVAESTASDFFKAAFGGHRKYRAVCANTANLLVALKVLNNEYAPRDLFGAQQADARHSDDADE